MDIFRQVLSLLELNSVLKPHFLKYNLLDIPRDFSVTVPGPEEAYKPIPTLLRDGQINFEFPKNMYQKHQRLIQYICGLG